MKPMHATTTRLSRCPCCQSAHSKKNSGRRGGKGAARQQAKRDLRRSLKSE